MEKLHAMTFGRRLTLLLASAAMAALMVPGLTSALTVPFDLTESGDADLSDQCDDLDISDELAGILGCDSSGKIIDFTEYTGEFEGPDASGYDSALTQSDNARDFIQTIVNFALSFLGLLAVIMVIYGGFLYVGSRGDEEMTTKGKKTITYAAIGIIIILGSFALVNTLIGAGGGQTGSSTLGSGTDGTTITEAGASFNVDAVLDELEAVTEEYTEAYETFIGVTAEIQYLQSLELPYVVELEVTDSSIEGVLEFWSEWLSGTDSSQSDAYEFTDQLDIDTYVDDMRDGIQDIQRQVDSFSNTYEASQNLYNYLRSGTTSSLWPFLLDRLAPLAYAYDFDIDDFLEALSEQESPGNCADRTDETPDSYVVDDVIDDSSLVGQTVYDAAVHVIDDAICGYLNNIQAAANSDYEEVVYDLIDRMEELAELFEVTEITYRPMFAATSVGEIDLDIGSSLGAVNAAFSEAILRLEGENDSSGALNVVSASTLREFVNSMGELYTVVQNIEFVSTQLTASTLEGNAPLIVRFNALGTEDPSGLTVEDDQIFWDFDGDGAYLDDSYDENGEAFGDAASYEFKEAGTYRVRLKVLSQSSGVAAGVSTVTIKVEPPKSTIILDATAGTETTRLADHSSFPAIDVDDYKVTMAEAEAGIVFDASQSRDGNGKELIFAEWDFGDNEVISGNWSNYNTVSHPYGEEGTYDVSLTVTDETGVQDREYFKLYVASPAARISYSPTVGEVGTTFEFDGSGSTTDIGSIVNYSWTVSDDFGNTLTTGVDTTDDELSLEFDAPGIYTITLQVADSSGKSDTASVSVLVESQAPVALFDYEFGDSTQPSTLTFDAGDSYDPDEGDTLTYLWEFQGDEGDEYQITDGDEESEEVTVKYLETGDYSVTLTVYDNHLDELQQSASLTKTVEIDSVLDVDMNIPGDSARYLDENGELEVEIEARSEVATGFEVDFGDGETAFTESILNDEATFTHTYTEADVYQVTVTAYDDNNHTNSTSERLYIGSGEDPIAVIEVDGQGDDIGTAEPYLGNVNTVFRFDASNSINLDGTKDNLDYSWNFGDGTTASQPTVTHRFDEHLTYTITLTVTDEDDPTLSSSTTVDIEIEGIEPRIKGLTVTPVSDNFETPLRVNLNVDAEDEDGSINYITAWYYYEDDSATEHGTVISESTSVTTTVQTRGEQGEVNTVVFAVEVTDDDNNTVSIFDTFTSDELPTLEVINGPNDTPVAGFSVDRTSVFVGEEVTFSSTSYDDDGEIVQYWWDIEGDGFADNEPTSESSYQYTFSQVHPNGIQVRLKVEDDVGATDTSDALTIYVDAISEAPEAKFLADINHQTVSFSNNSDFDTENGASFQGIYWDFDLDTDSDGNGVSDDDYDSLEENPEHTYEEMGIYQVKMTVVDSVGQSDSVIQELNVIDTEDPQAAFTYTVDDTQVSFKNRSEVDENNDVSVRSYSWDFDDDGYEDSDDKHPEWDFDAYGEFEVSLTVEDSYGKTDTVIEIVEVPSPIQPVQALLTSVPQANSLGQVILEGSQGDVSFQFNAEGGSDNYLYRFDKNIFYDTDGDGRRDNDVDYDAESSGSWRTTFFESYGQIVVKLTVIDLETGEKDIDTIQVVFEGNLGGANLFNATPGEMMLFILSAIFTVVLAATLTVFHGQRKRH